MRSPPSCGFLALVAVLASAACAADDRATVTAPAPATANATASVTATATATPTATPTASAPRPPCRCLYDLKPEARPLRVCDIDEIDYRGTTDCFGPNR